MIKRNLLVMGLAVMLSACGFQLRGTGANDLNIRELDLSARNAYGDTVKQLRTALENNGVKVYSGAPYHLVLTNEQDTQRAATYTGGTRSAEYELTTVVSYVVQGLNNAELLSDTLEVHKMYVHDGNNITGSDLEAQRVRKEMRNNVVQGLMLRLQQLTPAQLDELQRKADLRAKAEAEQMEAARRAQDATPQQSPMEVPAN
ncbi:LPS assembly lipoprotein LptE [Pseudomonas cremoricolorata]|uniref:LPS-assembly lipoprotein LptE n=1 Tax=Pseudomonas cremoricolorata TaxID=157783 RepID=A0A089WS10_9PSED|nr:LPS assembly lipoprotein LptE [Pseudomonas cremoricolorata]AIR89277.1 lipoprotein [Pseudomonas cremoricolorata]